MHENAPTRKPRWHYFSVDRDGVTCFGRDLAPGGAWGNGLVSSKPWSYGAVGAFDSVGDLEDERRHPVPARDSPSSFAQWKWD